MGPALFEEIVSSQLSLREIESKTANMESLTNDKTQDLICLKQTPVGSLQTSGHSLRPRTTEALPRASVKGRGICTRVSFTLSHKIIFFGNMSVTNASTELD